MNSFKSLCFLAFSILSIQSFAMPLFELRQMNGDGGTYKMSDHPTGIFVIEAYFLNCPYCNMNAPKVNSVAEKFASDPRVQVLDVGVDKQDADYEEWIERHHPNHPVLNDKSKKVLGPLGVMGYPSTYVFDCKGNLVHNTVGSWEEGDQEGIEQAIEALQSKDCHQ